MAVVSGSGVAVGDHDHPKAEGTRVARRGLATHIGHRAGDQHGVDISLFEQLRQLAATGEERAVRSLLDKQIAIAHSQLMPETITQ